MITYKIDDNITNKIVETTTKNYGKQGMQNALY